MIERARRALPHPMRGMGACLQPETPESVRVIAQAEGLELAPGASVEGVAQGLAAELDKTVSPAATCKLLDELASAGGPEATGAIANVVQRRTNPDVRQCATDALARINIERCDEWMNLFGAAVFERQTR